jgi:dipeptide/tripeptide permease
MFKQHPKGLIVLAIANMGERFGYYTMLAILACTCRPNSDSLRPPPVLSMEVSFHWYISFRYWAGLSQIKFSATERRSYWVYW